MAYLVRNKVKIITMPHANFFSPTNHLLFVKKWFSDHVIQGVSQMKKRKSLSNIDKSERARGTK